MHSPIRACSVVLEPVTPRAQQLGLSAELRKIINERNNMTARSRARIITALTEISDESEADTGYRKNHALQELLDTELAYVRQLELLINFFMVPIIEKNLIGPSDFKQVFGSIETIYSVHEELAAELNANLNNLAHAFHKLGPFFKLYSVYAYNYKRALKTLQRLTTKNESFKKFVDNQESRPEVQTKLTSLLIMPVQRIPRYGLLLKQVLDHTRKMDSDYDGIFESWSKVEQAAKHINKLVADYEHSERLLELQHSLRNGHAHIIKPGRKLLREGYIIEDQGKAQKCYLILFTDILLICKIIKRDLSALNALKSKYEFPLHKCRIRENAQTKMFAVHCQGCVVTLYDTTGSASDEWLVSLRSAIAECFQRRSTIKKCTTDWASASLRVGNKKKVSFAVQSDASDGSKMNRKRKLTDDVLKENVDVESPQPKSKKKSEKATKTPSRLSAFNICKRKPPHQLSSPDASFTADEILDSTTSDRDIPTQPMRTPIKDCLYPLREKVAECVEKPNTDLQLVASTNVFRFGENNESNSSFAFNKIVAGIGKSIRRLFGRS